MLTLRALLDDPTNGLHLVHAHPEQLDRAIPGAFLTDLPDPSPFLREGVMVLSSGIWARVDNGVERFVSALATAGAGSLVLGLIDLGVLPEAVIDACKRFDLPLIVTDDHVLYSDIARRIDDAADPGGAALLASVFEFSRTVSSSSTVIALLDLFKATFEVSAALIQRGGLVIRQTGAALDLDAVATASLDIDRYGAQTTSFDADGRHWLLTPLTQGSAEHGALAITETAPLSGAMSIAVSAACAVLRALTLQEDAAQATPRAAAAELLTPGVEMSALERAARFRIAGGRPGERVAILHASIDASVPAPATVLELIAQSFSPASPPIARLERQGLTAMVRTSTDAATDLIDARTRLQRLAAVLGGRNLRIGISDPFVDLGQLPSALAEAYTRHDSLVGPGITVAADSSAENHRALLAGLPADALADFSGGILAALIDYDRRTDAHLVDTLRQFLIHLGRWQDAAESLHIHANTLRYRVGRIESLTGRSLSDIAGWVDFQLALERLDHT